MQLYGQPVGAAVAAAIHGGPARRPAMPGVDELEVDPALSPVAGRVEARPRQATREPEPPDGRIVILLCSPHRRWRRRSEHDERWPGPAALGVPGPTAVEGPEDTADRAAHRRLGEAQEPYVSGVHRRQMVLEGGRAMEPDPPMTRIGHH